jgi:O-antigen ligase
MTPPHTQALRGGNFANPAAPAWPVRSAAAPRPAFYLTIIFVFMVYGRFPEIMDMLTGSAVHSVRVIMLLALVAALLFGGEMRAVFSKVGICLIAFTLWLCACIPFSIWRGGSFRTLRESWALSLFCFMIIVSTVQGLEQCRRILYSFAAATIFIECIALMMGRVQSGRMALLGGSLGNANDLAMMLLMGVPVCLFVIRTKPGRSLFKLACVAMIFLIPATVATTGSRGGLVTMAIMFILYFLPLPISQKVVVILSVLILAVCAVALSTRSALDRYKAIFASSDQAQLSDSERSALDSSELRKELLRSSLQLTLRHPLLGVGPGMFEVANANFTEETTGRSSFNAWHETHNTFTQLSCEDGLPGLFLYCLALLLCFKIVRSAEKRARQDPSLSAVRHMAFALRLALIAFTGTALFASNAYMYYFPMLAAFCVVLDRATALHLASLTPAGAEQLPAAPQAAKAPARFRLGTLADGHALAWKRPPAR